MNRQIAQLKIVSLSFSFENLFFLNKLYVYILWVIGSDHII